MKIIENFYIYSKQPRFYVPVDIIKLFKPRTPCFKPFKKKKFCRFICKKFYSIYLLKEFKFNQKLEILRTFSLRPEVFKDRTNYETHINKDFLFHNLNKADFFFKLGSFQLSLLLIKKKKILFTEFFPRILFRLALSNWCDNNKKIFIFKGFSIKLFNSSRILNRQFN
jgi:hypothetical protein